MREKASTLKTLGRKVENRKKKPLAKRAKLPSTERQLFLNYIRIIYNK